ncbi:LLM class flavin-dependent oxidoreductase [Chryseobacterium taklimakanense]|uniref:LLM class flavin-dependent oxidoreductase n=1 Tax=Chryseobacterium taklimakanense TaxID=536441 RepID=UPI001EF61E07|nr:LLM class flavin-dependent oxidoreductase [Chryseobacterium taklimakanense]MCG7280363.1 LLM class flavin-dependent oxidoreductase [Chryseobacterium taklimakanense]
MKLSILDQGPISMGQTPQKALENMRAAVKLADKLGYHRFWFAEHHNTEGFASSAPEISIAHLAGQTERIRLGSGGTMMMHYSPYKMAETFKTLSAYAPGRIDFGAGRAPGGDGKSILALSEGKDTRFQDLYKKLAETLNLMKDENGEDYFNQNVVANPTGIILPEVFLLGSTGNSALEAGKMGLSYAYVQFFTGTIDRDIFEVYRENFEPSAFQKEPNVLACYMVTVAETHEEAEFQALSSDIARMQLHTGQRIRRMSPEDAQTYPLSDAERLFMEQNKKWHIRGEINEVVDYLKTEQQVHQFDELMICTIPFAQDFKLKEYEMLAKGFGLI